MVIPNSNYVLDMLRQLPPRERLKVISLALPEIEKTLRVKVKPRKSMRGLWKDLHPSISAGQIDAVRKEMWSDFPREGIA
jgi:hypothetical protein